MVLDSGIPTVTGLGMVELVRPAGAVRAMTLDEPDMNMGLAEWLGSNKQFFMAWTTTRISKAQQTDIPRRTPSVEQDKATDSQRRRNERLI